MPVCPRCSSEYKEGFDRCADCDVELVESLPPEALNPAPSGGFKAVLVTTRQDEALIARSILETHGIRTFIENEHGAMLAIGIPSLAIPYEVKVPEENLEEAQRVLRETRNAETSDAQGQEKPSHRSFRTSLAWIIGVGGLLLGLSEHIRGGASGGYLGGISWAGVMIGLILLIRTHHLFAGIPMRQLVIFFLWGGVGAGGIALGIERLLDVRIDVESEMDIPLCGLVGFVEETAKILGPVLILGYLPAWRKNPYAWALAGAAAGGGFGVFETTFGYAPLMSGDHPAYVFMMRSGVLYHMLLTFFVGFAIAKKGAEGGIYTLLVAAFAHALWNALCDEGWEWFTFILLGLGILLLWGVLSREKQELTSG